MDNSQYFPEKEALYGCLASQHGLGSLGLARLLETFGSAEGVYAADPERLRAAHPRLSAAMAASLARGPSLAAWEELVETCRAHRILITAPGWPGYPQPLLDLEGPPPLLFMRGACLPGDARAVALVGTRNPTAYGREAAFTLARDLTAAGYTVASGLAMGIDAAAHAGALAAPARAGESTPACRTIAVIGCGLDIAYPLENLGVRERIEAQGAVISEFPPGTPPRPAHFPRRNRLISGLARATVVVEAGAKSGALLTAAHARNQDKFLFAVPGPIFSSVSSGTNALLRKGALLAATAADITALLEHDPDAPRVRPVREPAHTVPPVSARLPRSQRAPAPALTAALATRAEIPDDPVLRLWGADEVCAVDTLAARAGEEGAAALMEALLRLELRGLVRRLPGAAYRRTGRG
jgi:DNA processing protein